MLHDTGWLYYSDGTGIDTWYRVTLLYRCYFITCAENIFRAKDNQWYWLLFIWTKAITFCRSYYCYFFLLLKKNVDCYVQCKTLKGETLYLFISDFSAPFCWDFSFKYLHYVFVWDIILLTTISHLVGIRPCLDWLIQLKPLQGILRRVEYESVRGWVISWHHLLHL